MIMITSHQGTENRNHNEVLLHPLEQLHIATKETINAGRDVGEKYTLLGNVN